MKLAIVGSRGITEFDMALLIDFDVECIISGGASGVDRLAIEFAKANGMDFKEIKPDYKRYGRCAPILRNKEIVNEADFVIVIWDGISKGTKSVIDYCKKMNKPHRVEIKKQNTDSY